MKKKLTLKFLIMVLLILIAFFISITAYNIKYNHRLNKIEQYIKNGTVVITDIMYSPVKYLNDKLNLLKEYDSLYSDYKNIITKIQTSEYYENYILELKDEINQLKELMNLSSSNSDYNLVYTSISLKTNNYYTDNITIDKGSSDKIDNGMLVINESGLIGYVVNTTSRYSTVQLLNTNKNFDSISVKIRLENDDNVYGLLSSYDSNKNLYKIEGINTNIDIPLNSTVVTSGLSINAPGGILVGYVESVSIDDLGLISTIYVRPSVNFKNISTVGVLIK